MTTPFWFSDSAGIWSRRCRSFEPPFAANSACRVLYALILRFSPGGLGLQLLKPCHDEPLEIEKGFLSLWNSPVSGMKLLYDQHNNQLYIGTEFITEASYHLLKCHRLRRNWWCNRYYHEACYHLLKRAWLRWNWWRMLPLTKTCMVTLELVTQWL